VVVVEKITSREMMIQKKNMHAILIGNSRGGPEGYSPRKSSCLKSWGKVVA